MKNDPRTFCNDGAALEPWTLSDFVESNAEDPDVTRMMAELCGLAVGESTTFGGGAVAETRVTRLS